jgi:peptidoglycan/LPS O-acetylase OafA/YrhL
MQPAAAPTNGYLTVDLMRFLAAVTVVWAHVWGVLTPFDDTATGVWKAVYISAGFGQDAVRVFFIISGYWITASILRKSGKGSWTWPSYFIDRFSRLWLVLIPALLIGLALDYSGRFVLDLPRYSDFDFVTMKDVDIATSLTPEAFFGNLAFLQTVYVPTFGSNAPLWSLTNEFWYYIWFPALLFMFRGKLSIMTLVTLATMVLFYNSGVTSAFLIWLLGSAVYVVTNRIGATWRTKPALVRNSAVAASLALFLVTLAATHLWSVSWLVDGLIVGIGFSILLTVIIAFDVGIPKILHSGSAYGAKASYSLYLIHFPLMLFLASTVFAGQVFVAGPFALMAAIGLTLALVAFGWLFGMATEAHTGKVRNYLSSLLLRDPGSRSAQPKTKGPAAIP